MAVVQALNDATRAARRIGSARSVAATIARWCDSVSGGSVKGWPVAGTTVATVMGTVCLGGEGANEFYIAPGTPNTRFGQNSQFGPAFLAAF